MEDTRYYDLDFHQSKFNVMICVNLDRLVDQNERLISLLEAILNGVRSGNDVV
jgi:hypothetical protein